MARRPNEFLSTEVVIPYDHAALSATTTVEIYKADRAMRVVRVNYVNPTGLAQSGSNSFALTLKVGATVVANGIDTATTAIPAGGFTAMTVVPAAARIPAGSTLSFVATRTGTATLPAAGRLQVELAYV